MNNIPEFDVALGSFRRFLRENGQPDGVFWIFRDDLWLISLDRAFVRSPPVDSEALARKVYEEGRTRGLVSIDAIATNGSQTAATIWFPKFRKTKSKAGHRTSSSPSGSRSHR
jgi:hypothetical protein